MIISILKFLDSQIPGQFEKCHHIAIKFLVETLLRIIRELTSQKLKSQFQTSRKNGNFTNKSERHRFNKSTGIFQEFMRNLLEGA